MVQCTSERSLGLSFFTWNIQNFFLSFLSSHHLEETEQRIHLITSGIYIFVKFKNCNYSSDLWIIKESREDG